MNTRCGAWHIITLVNAMYTFHPMCRKKYSVFLKNPLMYSVFEGSGMFFVE